MELFIPHLLTKVFLPPALRGVAFSAHASFFVYNCYMGLCVTHKAITMGKLKFCLVLIAVMLSCIGSYAQQRFKIADGISLISYGNQAVIEDDNKNMSISVTISQQNLDNKNGEKMYKVACKGFTKTVIKSGLKQAISVAISSSGFPTIAKYASNASGLIYDAVCAYYGEKYD